MKTASKKLFLPQREQRAQREIRKNLNIEPKRLTGKPLLSKVLHCKDRRLNFGVLPYYLIFLTKFNINPFLVR